MFDCCLIDDELDILDIRLNVLSNSVEKFVIVESNRTHSGIEKPYNLEINLDRFNKFKEKIIYIKHEGQKTIDATQNWGNENTQRNLILKSLDTERPKDGLFLVCDVDEIPDPKKIALAVYTFNCTKKPVRLGLRYCSYYFNYACKKLFYGPYLYNPDNNFTYNSDWIPRDTPTINRLHACSVEYGYQMPTLDNMGWHFSSMGGPTKLQKKIKSFAHSYEFNELADIDYLTKCMVEGNFFFKKLYDFGYTERLEKFDIDELPEYIVNNIDLFEKYILK